MKSAFRLRMLKYALPVFTLVSSCGPVGGLCWNGNEEGCAPPHAGPPHDADAEAASEAIDWDVLEGHLGWSRSGYFLIADASAKRLTRIGFGRAASLGGSILALSPDATQVAFAATLHYDWEYRAFVAPLAGGKTIALRHAETYGAWATEWSPDGTRIYVSATPVGGIHGQDDIFEVLPDGSQPRMLPIAASSGPFAVSPDGRHIATGGGGIVVAPIDGTAPTRISTAPVGRDEYGPAWSPDGSRIAFVSRHGPNEAGPIEPQVFDIVLINPDGTGREVVLSIPFEGYPCDTHVAWAPSGTKLAYNRCSLDVDGWVHLNVLDLESRQSVPVTRGRVFDGKPSWVR